MRWRFAVALFDHAILGAFALGLQVALVRLWQPVDYGIFGFWLSVGDFAFAAASALLFTPLAVNLPRAGSAASRRSLQGVVAGGLVPLVVVSAAGCGLVATWLTPEGMASDVASLAGVAMIAAWLCRTHASATFFALQRPAGAATVDATHVGIASILLVTGRWAYDVPGVPGVLAILAFSQAVASLVGAAMVGVHPRAFWSRWWLGRYAPLWHQARWSLLGALTTMTQIRAQVVIVGTLADPAAYGAVFAGGILSGPVRLAAVAWSMVARPRLAEAAGRGERAVVRRLTVLPGLLFTAAFVVLAAAMAAAWPLIRAFLFVQYGDEMVPIVATWLASSYVQCLSDCVSAALQGLHEFRRLAIATVWGALVSLTAAFAAVLALGYPWVMLGPFLGQLVALGWMAQALRRSLAELPASA